MWIEILTLMENSKIVLRLVVHLRMFIVEIINNITV